MAKMYNNGKPRKKRAKSSYTTYKQHIRALEKKGYVKRKINMEDTLRITNIHVRGVPEECRL